MKQNIEKYKNYDITTEIHKNYSSRHREDGPAVISYKNDILILEQYYINDNFQRTNGPAHIEYHDNGILYKEKYYTVINQTYHTENVMSRDNNFPAYIEYYKNGNISKEIFLKNGKYFRDYGPHIIEHYENGITKLEIYVREHQEYNSNNNDLVLHREDGPAYIRYDITGKIREEKYYYRNEHYIVEGPFTKEKYTIDKINKILNNKLKIYYEYEYFIIKDNNDNILKISKYETLENDINQFVKDCED